MGSKWQSRRWLVTFWAMCIVTSLMLYSVVIQYSPDWMGLALPLLLGIIGGYIAADSLTKPKG